MSPAWQEGSQHWGLGTREMGGEEVAEKMIQMEGDVELVVPELCGDCK